MRDSAYCRAGKKVARFGAGQSAATMFAHVRRNRYTFSYSDCRHSAKNNLRGCVALSQRLSLYIRIIKPKRQRTFSVAVTATVQGCTSETCHY
jgi:hypothetical protein